MKTGPRFVSVHNQQTFFDCVLAAPPNLQTRAIKNQAAAGAEAEAGPSEDLGPYEIAVPALEYFSSDRKRYLATWFLDFK